MKDELARVHKQREKELLMLAPHHQGGHSEVGEEIARELGIPFPVRMPDLERVAWETGYDPDELWPWLASLRNQTRSENHA